jgi:hypothetical protein
MPTHSPGRPREFTPALQSELLNHVADGATVEMAARIAAISLRTVQREAKDNDDFHHDLELALQAAPVDPEQLMRQAARTHWRAAAWMLERAEPDRYGKRPPNSCSVEKLRGIMAHLIELALEATAAEQRAAVYSQMRPAADKALKALTPEPRESQRWIHGLATRSTPLSDYQSQSHSEDDGRHFEDDKAQRRPTPASITAPNAPVRDALPPDGGIMSPEMHFATECDPTESSEAEPTMEIDANAPVAAGGSPKRSGRRSAKSRHVFEKTQARRARRQIARAKRKARKAA